MLVRRFALSERADVACCGMTVAQAATLEVLRAEGAMRLGALGRRLGISPSTLSRNLRRLQARDLLTRLPDPDDTRAAFANPRGDALGFLHCRLREGQRNQQDREAAQQEQQYVPQAYLP